ncbi:MAG TPA: hypothetical protein VLV16_11095 [Gemmatimonadales bacterium]|nr:hypothetical protein [Gemmatimonadales bacterium]
MLRASHSYVGRWRVTRADTLTLPEMGDRFTLVALLLDSERVQTGTTCRLRGALVFAVPRADTFAVTWAAEGGEAFIYGWPADLGPFGGIGATLAGRPTDDTLRGALLFDSRLGIQVKPGVTAQLVARRMPAQ